MDSEMARAHGHRYDQDPLHPAVGGEEEHHEKKSVIKKVKDKAKKIKNTLGIKKHGHGHEHEHGHNEYNEEDEDDEDEEIVQDPEIHCAPVYDSAAAKNFASGQGVNSGQSRVSLGHKSPFDENQDHNVCPGTFQSPVTDPDTTATTAPMYNSTYPRDLAQGTFEFHVPDHHPSGTTAPMYDSASPRGFAQGHDVNSGHPTGALDESHVSEDLHPSNETAPRHGEEAGVDPILHSFDKMKIHDEPQREKETTGSHDQFSPSQTPTPDFSSHKIDSTPENIPSVPESFSATTETFPQDMNVDEPTTQRQPGYTDKISAVTSAIVGKAIAAKNVAASKIGYGGNNVDAQTPKDVNVEEPATQRQPGYTDKISSVTSAVTDKAISAKNVVASKMGYGGNIDNAQSQKVGENVTSAGVPIASTENLSATENAGEPVKNQTTYTEKLSGATSALAGTAISAKNAVASKIGYGGGDKTAALETEVNRENNNEKSSAGGVTGYGRQISSTVTEKLAPVYGTVAGAGTAVLSKIPGTGMGSGGHKNTDEDTSMGSPRDNTGTDVVGETDKGVIGMKDYIAEKLKPSEDDKALSEVISHALPKRTGSEETPQEKRAVGEVVSDAFHKRNNEEDRYGENKPMGKVTESDEVANRLGSTEEEKSGKVSGSDSPGTGMVDKLKGTFTNWFGKGGEMNPSQASNDSQSRESQGTTGDGERRLQESTN